MAGPFLLGPFLAAPLATPVGSTVGVVPVGCATVDVVLDVEAGNMGVEVVYVSCCRDRREALKLGPVSSSSPSGSAYNVNRYG